MCASSPDKVEILDPPSGAAPGDRVTFQGFPGTSTRLLSPQKQMLLPPQLRIKTMKEVPSRVSTKCVVEASHTSRDVFSDATENSLRDSVVFVGG